MKKILKNWYIYIITLIIIGLGIFLIYKLAFKDDNESESLIYINVSELQEKINNKDNFMLVISQTGCPHCEQYLPELTSALEEVNFKAYVLNLTNLTKEENITFASIVNITGTPTSIFYKNGVETTSLNRIYGYTSKRNILERLKSLGYIE